MAEVKNTKADDSVIITEAPDGKSFTVSDNPNCVPAPAYVYEAKPMTKNDVIAFSVFGTLFAAVIGGIGWFAYKEDQKQQAEAKEYQEEMRRKREERQAWFDRQRKEGRTVIETAEGKYLAIPNEAYAAAEERSKAL